MVEAARAAAVREAVRVFEPARGLAAPRVFAVTPSAVLDARAGAAKAPHRMPHCRTR